VILTTNIYMGRNSGVAATTWMLMTKVTVTLIWLLKMILLMKGNWRFKNRVKIVRSWRLSYQEQENGC